MPARQTKATGEQKVSTSKSALSETPKQEFCGTLFDTLSPVETLERCKSVKVTDNFRYIVTPNVDHIVRLNKEPDVFKPLYKPAWLCVCDSRILELLAKFSGIKLPAVPGSDLTAQLFDNVIKADDPVNVIGADPDVIEKVIARYGLTHLAHHQPPMGLRRNVEAIDTAAKFIVDNPANYTFICVGSPQQEMVAKAALERGDAKGLQAKGLGLCVGASLDFLAGKIKRAPKWMQKTRLEWLHRLASEPGRMWKRYLVEGPKIFIIWYKWQRQDRRKNP
ncbi:MAG: WecB/TagA/CpsF family glycosyltransferase [Robiginitomaculum sp.]|nr:WecB/TagA/CpsF family glycosyltransferase [Robiginitomaculum sp.]